ncbi:serine/threonine-protein kinase [Tropicimonas sp. TH_r6]|uniref:serine/threonine-protein kinase n=1 Tax=Tropicimonas sp. TH_r6 TaxID=3082085 RepID=UPI002953A5D1|nr:serine/threonine-protein kinase [Tropicimonas sp. TH_r6]MDV7141152.1 serine/threonine-protein kinase [Tropicimonas sp. TH_r6]
MNPMTATLHVQGAPPDSLPPGTPLLQGQFIIDSFLNAGGFGITYLARNSLERRVVLKECYPSTMCCRSQAQVRARTRGHQTEFDVVVRLFGEEARRLAKLNHPNIVGVHDVFEDNGTAYMALDYVEGRDLFDVIETEPQRLDPSSIRTMTQRLLEAVAHVHSHDVLHRDISPDNILLDAGNDPILIDFGAARDTARRASRVLSALQVVKDGYSPQEFYLAGAAQSPAGDLYSLAATLYHVLTGDPPIYSHMRLAALAERKPDPYVPLVGRLPDYDNAFLSAIDRALKVFAKDRLQSAEEWLEFIDVRARRRAMTAQVSEDPAVADRIRKLVEDTNAAVRVEQERAARETAETARREAEAARVREEARERRRAQAIREAEEAEQALRFAAEAEEIARREAAEAEDRARREAETAQDDEAETLQGVGTSSQVQRAAGQAGRKSATPGWFSRVWRGRRSAQTAEKVGQMEGYGA